MFAFFCVMCALTVLTYVYTGVLLVRHLAGNSHPINFIFEQGVVLLMGVGMIAASYLSYLMALQP